MSWKNALFSRHKVLLGKFKVLLLLTAKTLRGSGEMASDLDVIHRVSAFAAENEIILGQLKTAGTRKRARGDKAHPSAT
jgi:hypothetical protein